MTDVLFLKSRTFTSQADERLSVAMLAKSEDFSFGSGAFDAEDVWKSKGIAGQAEVLTPTRVSRHVID